MPALPRILEPICRSADAIEGAFLKASEGLSRGLDAFQALNAAVTGLGREFDSGSIGSAAVSLDGLCLALRAIGEQLPEDVVDATRRSSRKARRSPRGSNVFSTTSAW